MSYLQTPTGDVRIFPFPSKPSNLRTVRVGRTLVGVSKTGLCFSTDVRSGCYYLFGNSRFTATFEGLSKLGALSKEQVEKFSRIVIERKERDERRWAARDLVEAAKRLGQRLTKAQLAAVEAAGQAPEED